jgi:carboxylesterase type B
MTHDRRFSRLLVILGAGLAAQACGPLDPNDPSRVGDGIGSTATERGELRYDPVHGCTPGTEIILNPEPGAGQPQILCGVVETDGAGHELHVYQGIQYAASPAGSNRWRDPQPPQWRRLRAVEFGPACPQGSKEDAESPNIDEDCLYLNIWTPEITTDASGELPVMVFIHGGAFISGDGGDAKGQTPGHLNLYDGTEFVTTSLEDAGPPVVFVTLNYRLGALGLLAGDEAGLTGNYAIKDQTKALEWVQRNISLFGGDPDKVTIFGESAGAQSVALHLSITEDDHQSLFRRALMESNYGIGYMDLEAAQRKADDFAFFMDCGSASDDWSERLQCLRSADLGDILEHQLLGAFDEKTLACQGLQAILPWNPVRDGRFIVEDPIAAAVTKPVILGSNLTESIPFIASWFPEDTRAQEAAYIALLDFLFGPIKGTTIIALYALQYPDLSIQERLEQVVTDYLWTCFNRSFASVPTSDVWRYFYRHSGSYPFWVDDDGKVSGKVPEACAVDDAVCHATELPFVFGNPVDGELIKRQFTAAEADMSAALRAYWIEFARRSNPDVATLPPWPLNHDGVLDIEAPASAIEAVRDAAIAQPANCDLIWDRVGYEVTSAYDCSEVLGAE